MHQNALITYLLFQNYLMFPIVFSSSQSFSSGSNFVILGTLFMSCIATSDGGGLFVSSSNSYVKIDGCSFISCKTIGNGGGFFCNSNICETNNCCYQYCDSKLGSSMYTSCSFNSNIRSSCSFGNSSSAGSFLLSGSDTNFLYGNVSFHHSDNQVTLLYVTSQTKHKCSYGSFVHSKDSSGCSFTIHYSKDSVLEYSNIYNISSGQQYSLIFFGWNSRVRVENCLLYKSTHPKGFEEYSNTNGQFYEFIGCSVNFPLSDFGSWNTSGSIYSLSATYVQPVGNNHYDCNIYIGPATENKKFNTKGFLSQIVYLLFSQ